MKTIYSFSKSENVYYLRFCVEKIHCEYCGNQEFPFNCDILTSDNKTFRCAVKMNVLSNFLLAKKGDKLLVTLISIYPRSRVLGVEKCRNLSVKWKNIIFGKNLAVYDYAVDEIVFIHMPFEILNRHYIPQDFYFCLIKGTDTSFVAFRVPGDFISKLAATQKGDIVDLLGSHFCDDAILSLYEYKNNSRQTEAVDNLLETIP